MEAYQRLERDWAEWNGLPPADMVACASGTAALHLAFEALQLPPGSEVICPDFAMIACPRAIAMAGHTPVFVDCGEDLLIDPEAVDRAVANAFDGVGNSEWKSGRRISAVLAVNVYGREYDVFGVRKATESYGIKVVEDLAESHGVRPSYNADAACWSFFQNKVVAGHEGGAVWFRDPDRAQFARQLRCLGFTEAHDFRHIPRGWNHRLSNVHAEAVLDSLGRVEDNLRSRRRIEEWYDVACPDAWHMPTRTVPWVYDVRVPGMTAGQQTAAVRELRAMGIQARHAFQPMSSQEEYRGCRLICGEEHRAARLAREVIYLPLTPGRVTPEQAAAPFGVLRRIVG